MSHHAKRAGPASLAGLLALLLPLLAACQTSTYGSKGCTTVLLGRMDLAKDAAALAGVRRVALTAFIGRNQASDDGAPMQPLLDLAYEGAKAEIAGQGEVEFLLLEDLARTPAYAALALSPLPAGTASAVHGATSYPAVEPAGVAALCEALGVDAIMMVRIDYDWEFPSWNMAKLKRMRHVALWVPPDGRVAWELKEAAWSEKLLPMPSNLKAALTNFVPGLGMPGASELATIVDAVAPSSCAREDGGYPLFLLLDNAQKARGGD